MSAATTTSSASTTGHATESRSDQIYDTAIEQGAQIASTGLWYTMSGLSNMIEAIQRLQSTVMEITAILAEETLDLSEDETEILAKDTENIQQAHAPNYRGDLGVAEKNGYENSGYYNPATGDYTGVDPHWNTTPKDNDADKWNSEAQKTLTNLTYSQQYHQQFMDSKTDQAKSMMENYQSAGQALASSIESLVNIMQSIMTVFSNLTQNLR